MKIAIAGGTGLVGKELTVLLQARGDEVLILTRKQSSTKNGIRYVQWLQDDLPLTELEGIDAFINLAGVSLNEGRWTRKQKQAIYNSRMRATEEMVRIIHKLGKKPSVVVNASAVGIYPVSTTAIYDETADNYAQDFLGKTVAHWERRAAQCENYGVRTCFTRFGVILDQQEGALPLIALPYKMFVGGPVGSGEQWVSWVHVRDVARAILFAIDTPSLRGPINVVAPDAVRMEEFGETLANVLNKPHWLPVPSVALKLALGEKSILVLKGQHVLPKKLQQANFEFQFPTLQHALEHLYKS